MTADREIGELLLPLIGRVDRIHDQFQLLDF